MWTITGLPPWHSDATTLPLEASGPRLGIGEQVEVVPASDLAEALGELERVREKLGGDECPTCGEEQVAWDCYCAPDDAPLSRLRSDLAEARERAERLNAQVDRGIEAQRITVDRWERGSAAVRERAAQAESERDEARGLAASLAEAVEEARSAIARSGSGSTRRRMLPKLDAALVSYREALGGSDG